MPPRLPLMMMTASLTLLTLYFCYFLLSEGLTCGKKQGSPAKQAGHYHYPDPSTREGGREGDQGHYCYYHKGRGG